MTINGRVVETDALNNFGNIVTMVLEAITPLYKVLRLVGGEEKTQMRYVYNAI